MTQKAPAQPPPPDPVTTSRAQAEFNTDAARLNARLNRNSSVGPMGTVRSDVDPRGVEWLNRRVAEDRQAHENQGLTWGGEANAREFLNKQNPYADMWTETTTLSPEQQGLYDQTVEGQRRYGNIALDQLRGIEGRGAFEFTGPEMQMGVQDRAGDLTRGVQDRTGELTRSVAMQERPDFTGIGDPDQSRGAVEQALLSRINPDLERERSALESRLASQGITMGSQMWNAGMQDWSRMANDARFGAVREGGAEQSRMFGLGLQQAGFGNDARMGAAQFGNAATEQAYGMDMGRAQFGNAAAQQAYGMDMGRAQFGNDARSRLFQEQLALRAQPLNEAAALLSGQQVQMPQFNQLSQVQVQAPDYAGAVGQNYAGQMAGWQANSQRIGAQNAALINLAGQVGGAAAGGWARGGFSMGGK